jgi:uncharacterized membrane protein SpoIIM required for sporulation
MVGLIDTEGKGSSGTRKLDGWWLLGSVLDSRTAGFFFLLFLGFLVGGAIRLVTEDFQGETDFFFLILSII